MNGDDKNSPHEKKPITKIYPKVKNTCVYGLIDPRDGSLFWVGVTNSPNLRYDQHVYDKVRTNPGKQALIDEIIRSGNLPGMILIDEFKMREEALLLEKNLIVFLAGVSSIRLTNIEHMPDKTWSFKNHSLGERTGQAWLLEERLVLIGHYGKGAPCALIAKEVQRNIRGLHLEMYRLQKAGLLTVHARDQGAVDHALRKCKYPVRDIPESEVNQVRSHLHKVSMRYGALNADHLKYEFLVKKQPDGPN